MVRRKLITVIMVAAFASVLGLAACSSSSNAASSTAASTSASGSSSAAVSSESSASSLLVVGTEANGAPSFELKNKTGKAIRSIAVKATGEAAYPENMLTSDQVIANGEAVLLACPALPEPASNGSDVAVKRLADCMLVLSDESSVELHQLDVYDIASAEVRLDGQVAYLEYESANTHETVSTLESEKAIAQQKADAEAAQAQAEPAAAPAEAAPAYEGTSETYDSSSTWVNDSAVGSGDEAACVPDIVLR